MPKAASTPNLLATRFIHLMGRLFAAEARSAKWSADRRKRLRCRYSERVLAIIKQTLIEHLPTVVPGSMLGKALQYPSSQCPKLSLYVEHGDWPISNNPCDHVERVMQALEHARHDWIQALLHRSNRSS